MCTTKMLTRKWCDVKIPREKEEWYFPFGDGWKILLAPFVQLMSGVVFVLTVSPQRSNYKCTAVDSGVRLVQ